MLSRWKKRVRPYNNSGIMPSIDAARDFASELPSRITAGLDQHVGQPIQAAFDALLDLPSDLMDMITSERDVPVFLLPTGTGPRDFEIVFDFTEEVSALKSGVLARPVLNVWTGRTDIDEKLFLDSFQREFLEQFAGARGDIESHLNSETMRLSRERSTAVTGLAQQSKKTVRNSILILLGAPFLFDFIFLSWALDSSGKSAKHLVETVKLTNELRGTRRRSRKKMQEIEDRFSEREDALTKAVERLHLQEHPQLAVIHSLFNPEIEALPTSFELSEGIPDIRTTINLAEFRSVVPKQVRSKFDALFPG